MDGYENLDLDEIEFAPVEAAGERLLLLTLHEAHDLLDWLRLVAAERGAHAREAGRWAKEIAARVPSQE
ncbi:MULTISPECIES: DUF6417 family protein [unclassified Streptomyces]|uniref:DUF6417 family protein n=1 Tax=unclassified Streptomyces TaxID=2593676 RepID=UPI000B14E26B|nr:MULTISPECIES: DUF6417 family protein [unclassified Streptomyces]BCM71211.1 hypothetical protein EASAB2608_06545 [Streptomyces sp. EAS-AB2608]